MTSSFSNLTHFSTASSYSYKEKQPKKTIFIKTTTTKPPIVWFPGDPDCGEGDLGGSMSMLLKYVERFVMFSFQDHLKKTKLVRKFFARRGNKIELYKKTERNK